jgi:hypothetical protein
MTIGEKVDDMFAKIKDWKVKRYGMCRSDAAADIQEYMAQVCKEWCSEDQEYKWLSDSRQYKLLRDYMRNLKQSIKI